MRLTNTTSQTTPILSLVNKNAISGEIVLAA
jgi:hypothetical protein